MIQDQPKLCTKCKFSRQRTGLGPDGWSVAIRCYHPINLTANTSLVDGEVTFNQTDNKVLRNSTDPDGCGPSANWFEERTISPYASFSEESANRIVKVATKKSLKNVDLNDL